MKCSFSVALIVKFPTYLPRIVDNNNRVNRGPVTSFSITRQYNLITIKEVRVITILCLSQRGFHRTGAHIRRVDLMTLKVRKLIKYFKGTCIVRV